MKARVASLFLFLVLFGCAPSASAWGCKGHEVIALIAERHLSDAAEAMVTKILAAAPIDPALRRFCQDADLDAFADASTWADDVRTARPETAPWHFIDIPRGVTEGDLAQFCPPATGCITSAIAAQLTILRDAASTAQARGDALRFLIHFLGDLHEPLHTATNGDLGGNCVPVSFAGHDPEQTNPEREDYRPNLHAIWDVDLLDDFMSGQTSPEIADALDKKLTPRQISSWRSGPPDIVAWAWESHQTAEDVVYGRLPVELPVEAPRPVATCADNNHIAARMLKLGEKIDADDETAAAVSIDEQLEKAGIRLADVLNSLWP